MFLFKEEKAVGSLMLNEPQSSFVETSRADALAPFEIKRGQEQGIFAGHAV